MIGTEIDTAHQLGRQRDRAVVSAAGAAVASRLVTTVATVLTLAFAAHSLSTAQLGVVAVLTTLTVFLGFADFGLGTLLMTRLPAAHARGDEAAERELVTVTLTTLGAAAILVVVAGTFSAYLMPWPTLLGIGAGDGGEVRLSVLVFFLCGGVGIPATVGGRLLAAMQRSSVSHLWNAGAAVLAMVATALCALLDARAPAYVLAIAGVPALVGVVQTRWVVTRVFPGLRPTALRAPPRLIGSFLRAGSLFAILNLTAVVCYYIDSLVVSAVLGAAAAAVFALAARLFALVGGTLTLAGQQMWSALSDAIARGDLAWARSRFRRALGISTGINALACLILVLAGREVSRLWLGERLVPPLSLLIVLGVWTVYSTSIIQASYLLAAVEKIRILALAGVVMAPVNLALSIWFTHRWGLTGPILGSIVALALIQTLPVVVLSRRQLTELGA